MQPGRNRVFEIPAMRGRLHPRMEKKMEPLRLQAPTAETVTNGNYPGEAMPNMPIANLHAGPRNPSE